MSLSPALTCRIDGDWHHVALTWKYEDGETLLYFDGQNLKPYFKREGLQSELQDPAVGGVDSHMAGKTARYSRGLFRLSPVSSS